MMGRAFPRNSQTRRTPWAVTGMLVVCLLMASGNTPSRAITLSSDAPGNIFVVGMPLHLTAREAAGDVKVTLRDYFGHVAAQLQVPAIQDSAAIDLPAVSPGWYVLTAQDGAGENTITLGVVLDRKGAPLPRAGKICADAASAWLISDDAKRRSFAHMVKLAGIPWVRERMSWTQIEPKSGQFDWTPQYESTVDSYRAEGVHVSEIWHDSPPWTRAEKGGTLAPDDLRAVYRFTRAAAAHFSPTVEAWEVWNEPDITFWPDLSDRFAGLQKAAYWGLKDGVPAIPVLNGAFANPAGPFGQGLYRAGVGDYSDILNWHRYADPLGYPAGLEAHRAVLRETGAASRPAWLTEAGISLTGTAGEGKRLLSDDDQRRQARFIPRAAAMSLAAGDAKHFFFVLPDYLENGTQFGALKPDLTPYPSFVSLSATANLLGMSDYLGRYPTLPSIQAHWFRTPHGSILVAWSDQPGRLSLPTSKKEIAIADMFGAVLLRAVTGGTLTLDVGPDAIYILDPGERAAALVPHPKALAPRTVRAKLPSRVVLMGYAALSSDKQKDSYLLTKAVPFPYTVQAYNFDPKKAQSGEVTLTLPSGWSTQTRRQAVRLPPMGRAVLTFPMTPHAANADAAFVIVSGRFAGEQVAPSLSRFAFDPAALIPRRRQALDWANAAKWQTSNVSANGKTTLTVPQPGSLRIEAAFEGNGDRWAYPILTFSKPLDLSAWDGIAFDLKIDGGTPDSSVRLMLNEPSGSTYLGPPITAPNGPRRVVILFQDLQWGTFSHTDPDGKLDLNQIRGVLLGLNTSGAKMAFEASHFELVKFAGYQSK